MAKKYLIDTNVVIDFSEGRIPTRGRVFVAQVIDTEPIISVINKIELLGFSIVTTEIEELIDASTILDLSDDVVNKTIDIRKKSKLKLPDAIIAATASVHGLTILSRNVKDFERIQDLSVIDPYTL